MIEKNIPIPKDPKGTKIEEIFPELLQMQVGDSFVIANKDFRFGMFMAIALFGLENHQRHENRTMDNGDVRLWRVA